MTRIKRLTLHGFKSFANKTDIPFEKSFNCVIGSNGSGKSNVNDSLCFVLGRLSAKSLRAEKAANLIFNGGKKKKPASKAFVEIEFCNENEIFPTEEKSAVIRRAVNTKGQSSYFINGKKVTRTNVVDFLSHARINPNGHNIIAQGDITHFVDMSTTERRKIIEQISDISHYEEKKRKALLELSKVEEKLNNAQIILKERKTHLNALKKDRDQALKYKEVKDKIASHKATLLNLQIEKFKEEKQAFEEKISGFNEKIAAAQKKVDDLKADIENKKQEIAKINAEIEQKGEKEQVSLHKSIEELKVDIAKDKTRVSTLKDELSKIAQRREQFKAELKELENKFSHYHGSQKEQEDLIKMRERELKELEEKVAAFKKKHKIETSQELEQDIEQKEKLIEQKQEEMQVVRQEQQDLFREKDKVEFQLQSIDERIAKVKAIEAEHKDQIKVLQEQKKQFKQLTLKLNEHLNKDGGFAAQLANARRNAVVAQEKHAKLQAKAQAAQAHAASSRAVSALLEQKSKFKGLHGTVAQLGQVNSKYSLPLQVAAGAKLQNLVVENDQVAQECIEYLKKNKLGSASFIPLNKIRAQKITPDHKKLTKTQGVKDFALNLIKYDARYANAFAYVFGTTLIVDDIPTARKVGIGKIRMATVEGSLVEASGVMRGGFHQKRAKAGFQESDSLEEISKLDAEIAQLHSVIKSVEDKRAANEEAIYALRKEKSELEGEIIKAEKSLHLENSDLDATSTLKKELQIQLKELEQKETDVRKRVSAMSKELAMLKSDRQMIRNQVATAKSPQVMAQLSAFEATRQKFRDDVVRAQSDLKNARQNVDQLLAPEREKIEEILKQHAKEAEDFKVEVERLTKKTLEQEKELKVKEQQSAQFYAQYKGLFTQREKFNDQVNTAQNNIEKMRDQMRSSEQQANLISLKNAEMKAKLAALQEEFDRYKEAPLLEGKDLKSLQQEVAKFEVILSQMSAVNMKALEIYEKIEEEYEKLVEKRKSLESEKTQVHTLMNEIETKKKEHFMKTFKVTNDNFKRIFEGLFRKGNAYLEIEDPDNLFESGIQIKVKIVGKRYMDLKSLSGGEKTLTALSFIFAIQEHEPAHFYVLDEIDAALDKHNAELLAKLIRDYSDTAQYIVVSHNDALISEADTLYGVSMQEGVSKVTSLKI